MSHLANGCQVTGGWHGTASWVDLQSVILDLEPSPQPRNTLDTAVVGSTHDLLRRNPGQHAPSHVVGTSPTGFWDSCKRAQALPI